MTDRLPWIHELPAPDVEQALRQLAALPHCLLLDSALKHLTLGRYSFLAADPFQFIECAAAGGDPLSQLSSAMSRYQAETVPGLPPFQGGAAGLFAYELGRTLERIPAAGADEFQVPVLAVGLFDTVLAIDHSRRRGWVISQGFPETDEPARLRRAAARGRQMLQRLEAAPQGRWAADHPPPEIPFQRLVPQHAVPHAPGVTSDFSESDYRQLVSRAVDYIHAGDVFQVNLSQRLVAAVESDPLELYLRLRQRNRATFAAYFDLGGFQILSASPERLVSLRDGAVETRPIKGTRRMLSQPEADLYAAADLSSSVKDRSENVMIVDLLRNDLSRVCQADSVKVTQLCELEQYQYVQHLVSAVEGTLSRGRTPADLVRAVFPGGSITGAPKVRAMEIIAELEPTARGSYCGSLGYIGFDGAMDLSILIRTITAGRGWWQLPAGGGIVADSDPGAEYQETLDKARGMIRALRP